MLNALLNRLTRYTDKTGALGAIIAAMGCASCFPLLGSFAAALGLGFLAQFEGVFINTLLPIFAWLALIANIIAAANHRRWLRLLAGITGPALVLLSLYPWWSYGWSTYTFYLGLVLMLGVAIWDWISPANKVCATPCAKPTQSD